MSKLIKDAQHAAQLVASLLNLDISALQTTEIAKCREPIWELTQKTRQRIDGRWESVECLSYCIERLLSCLSEEAQALIQQRSLNQQTTVR